MSIPYELSGRTGQKARTRAAMVEAARALLAAGVTPTVEQAADRAAISRTTAYRYFQNQRALLLASYPELDQRSIIGSDAPAGAEARLDLVVDRLTKQVLKHEPELRAMLRMSLEVPPPGREELPLRQGRAIGWIADALQPLRRQLPPKRFRRLVLAIRAIAGIEALVWLCDVAQLSRAEAVELMKWSARALFRAAVADSRSTPAAAKQERGRAVRPSRARL